MKNINLGKFGFVKDMLKPNYCIRAFSFLVNHSLTQLHHFDLFIYLCYIVPGFLLANRTEYRNDHCSLKWQ